VTKGSADRLAAVYLNFAEREAHGRSALYETLARAVANDVQTLSMLGKLPRAKQQPNLLFAAVKYLYGAPESWERLRALLDDHFGEIGGVIMAQSTQTNEPARCATLVPLLARLPQPLALLEVGAAAGLCLLPDRYAYDYGGHRVLPTTRCGSTPTFFCRSNRATPLPTAGLQVVWRAGLDLRPIDLNHSEQVAWLEALVWPDEKDRLSLLRAAIQVARRDPPAVFQGDLRTDLSRLVAQAPDDATLVVFHTAVLGYVTPHAERSAFVRTVRDLKVAWISNEPPELFPNMMVGLSEPWPAGRFLLSMNEQPIAWTDPHGTFIDWIERS
jgi:hypothetical protein